MPPADLFALFLYKAETNVYMEVQRCLVEDDAGKAKERTEWHSFTRRLLRALRQIPPERGVVYRRMCCTREKSEEWLVPGKTLDWHGIPTCSRERAVVVDLMGLDHSSRQGPRGSDRSFRRKEDVELIFKIHALSIRSIAEFSYHPEQQEVLLLPEDENSEDGVRTQNHKHSGQSATRDLKRPVTKLQVVAKGKYTDFGARDGQSLGRFSLPELELSTASWKIPPAEMVPDAEPSAPRLLVVLKEIR